MLIIVEDPEALGRAAANVMAAQALSTLKKQEHFTIALSGGSTPKPLYERLADDSAVGRKLAWTKIHVFWGDERLAPPDHPESNYRLAYETLLSKVDAPLANVHRVRAENADASQAAADYEKELVRFFHLKPGELPRFDLVLLGMGADGHTASLFPDTPALHEKERLVVANWIDKLQTYRITLSVPVFNQAVQVMFLVSGEDKAETLREVLRGQPEPARFPAQLIKPVHGRLLWLVDRPAARLLG
jgi:6-phosphogluconolactonase